MSLLMNRWPAFKNRDLGEWENMLSVFESKKIKSAAIALFAAATVIVWSPTSHAAAVYESEPNNTQSQANYFGMFNALLGTISYQGDSDWGWFTSDRNGKIKLQLNTPTDGSLFHIWVRDGGGTMVAYATNLSGGVNFVEFNAVNGANYYVGIDATTATTPSYTLYAYPG